MFMRVKLLLSAAVFADELSAAVDSGMGSIKNIFFSKRGYLKCLKHDKRPLVQTNQ